MSNKFVNYYELQNMLLIFQVYSIFIFGTYSINFINLSEKLNSPGPNH